MKYRKGILVLPIIFLIFGVTTMTACGFLGIGGTEKWKEEVKLSDGRIIIVERERLLESGGDEWASNRRGLKPKEHNIKFVNPDGSGKKVEWRTIKKSEGGYPEIPLILDMDSGHFVMYTLVGVGPACEVYNKYVYRNGAWSEEALTDKFEPRIANLIVRSSDDVPKFINMETKRKINESEYSRVPVRQAGPNREICE